MRNAVIAAQLLLGILLLLPQAALASGNDLATAIAPDGALRTLAAGTDIWYRFDYGRKGSAILVELTDSGLADIRFTIHTPEQIESWLRGTRLQSVGQITRAGGIPNRPLTWAGHFNGRGTYYVVVRNLMAIPVTYRLLVSGPAVSIARNSPDDSNSAPSPVTPAVDPSAPPGSDLPKAAAPFARGPAAVLYPDAARSLAARNNGIVGLGSSIRLIAGARYENLRFQILRANVQIIGDINNPPTIIPPAGTYGISAEGVDSPRVAFINIQTSTLAQDQWKWYADITNHIFADPKYGGVLFSNVKNGHIEKVTIVGADGSTDGASHSAGVSGITLLDNTGTLVADSRLNGNIFGLIIAGGSENVVVDNVIVNNIRQGLVPGTGDLCNGCDSAGVAITYAADGSASRNNMIGLPGHGNWISGGNGVFVICNNKLPGGGGGHYNFFVENNLAAEWNGVEAVATEGNVFVRNVIYFTGNTVGYWLTGSTFTMDSRFREGLSGARGKIEFQITDARFGSNLSGAMRLVENPRLPDPGALPYNVREYLARQTPHIAYAPIP